MKNKNIVPILVLAGAAYYFFYSKSKKEQKGQKQGKEEKPEKLVPLDPSLINEIERQRMEIERLQAGQNQPKTLLAKAATLVKKAASTPEGKSLLKKGVKAITQNKQLKKLGATYL
jgi:hypothetical protein